MSWCCDITTWLEKPYVVQVFSDDGQEQDYLPERTCHMIVYKQDKDKPRHEQWGVCSECKELLEPSDNYCPQCGARVMEDKPVEVWQQASADDVTCYEVEK